MGEEKGFWKRSGAYFAYQSVVNAASHTATTGLRVERRHCARPRLYWYNGQYDINHARTRCSPVTTLCRFHCDVADVCALLSTSVTARTEQCGRFRFWRRQSVFFVCV